MWLNDYGSCVVDRWCCRQIQISVAGCYNESGNLAAVCAIFGTIFSANCDTKRVNEIRNEMNSRHWSMQQQVHHLERQRRGGQQQRQKKQRGKKMTRHWNKLAKHINYVAEHRGEASTHKIDNKQHEDCARQYLNAINKAAQEEKGQMVTAPKRDRAPNNNDAKRKENKAEKHHIASKLDRPSSEWNTLYLRTLKEEEEKRTTKATTNRPIHHTACVHNKAKVLKLDQIKLPIISLLHFQTSVRLFVCLHFCLQFDQFHDLPVGFAWITAWQMNYYNKVIASPMEFNWKRREKKQQRSKRSNVENHLNFDSCENISSSYLSHFFLREVFCFSSELASHVQNKTLLFAGVGRNVHDIWIHFFGNFFHFSQKKSKNRTKKKYFATFCSGPFSNFKDWFTLTMRRIKCE